MGVSAVFQQIQQALEDNRFSLPLSAEDTG